MEVSDIINFLTVGPSSDLLVKIFGIGISVFYLIFSVVIFKQTGVLNRIIKISEFGTVLFLSRIQVFFGLMILLYTLIIL